jgi:hypothetical protein
MEPLFIVPIVEGHGEVQAVPTLIHRVGRTVADAPRAAINRPLRVPSGSIRNNATEFRRQVTFATSRAAQRRGLVLLLLDSDDDCPAQLGPRLLSDARAVRSDVQTYVALAVREFETWFIAAAQSLRGIAGLADDAKAPDHFETIRNAKGWLAERMPNGYDPIQHQEAFTRAMDMEQACRARSFHRLYGFLRGVFEDARGSYPR